MDSEKRDPLVEVRGFPGLKIEIVRHAQDRLWGTRQDTIGWGSRMSA